jgi:hypothetical protein
MFLNTLDKYEAFRIEFFYFFLFSFFWIFFFFRLLFLINKDSVEMM